MAIAHESHAPVRPYVDEEAWRSPAHREVHVAQARGLLQFGFVVAPIVVGLDKFTNLLVDWSQYLSGFINGLVGGYTREFMMVVGVIEIAAGIGVALKPRVFGYVVAAWLWAIILNLLMIPGYFDIALRDFGLSLGALALAKLSAKDR